MHTVTSSLTSLLYRETSFYHKFTFSEKPDFVKVGKSFEFLAFTLIAFDPSVLYVQVV